MSFDPGKTMREVDEGADRMEKAADTLTEAIENYERLEHEYDYQLAIERTKVFHDPEIREAAGNKPPAADLRLDFAIQRIDPQLRADYAAAKASKEALMIRFRALEKALSARQSVLKALGGMA